MTALHRAAREGDLANLAAALDAGEDPNAADEAGWTALLAAAVGGRSAAVDLLLARGANPEYAPGGDTPLYAAAARGLTEVVARLLQDPRVDPNRRCDRGWGPLTAAAFGGHTSVLAALLARPDARPGARDAQGRNALWWAATAGHDDAARMLAGIPELHVPDDDGVGPADAAAAAGHEGLAGQLRDLAPEQPLGEADDDRYEPPDEPVHPGRVIREPRRRLRDGG